jgi:glycosyltransferase involved in cell wall biosynthesis
VTGRRRPIRIAYVTASLDHGGSERQMVALATRLPRSHFAPEFILLTHRGAFADQVEQAGIPVRVLGSARRATSRAPVFALRVSFKVLRYLSWIRRGRFDIVDAWLYHAYALAALTKPLAGTRVMVTGRRSLSDFKDGFGRVDRALDRFARHQSDAIVANAAAVRADVIRREGADPARIHVIRNGIDIPPPIASEERRAIRAAWGAEDRDVVIGTIANYKPGKGLESIVRVAETLASDRPDARFVLVGEGESRSGLEAMIAGRGLERRVLLHGAEPDARRLYGALDLLVQASETEGLPNVVLEGAAAGTAIVATDAGGTREIVEDGVTGLLVPVGDDAALGSAIRRLLDDAQLRQRLGQAAQLHAADAFSMDRLVAETAALYESLAARGRLVP